MFPTAPRKSLLLYADRPSEVRRRFWGARRFNRVDPFRGRLWDPLSLHKYSYVHGDPVQAIDPLGLFTLGAALSGLNGFQTALKSLSVGEFGGASPALHPSQVSAESVDELIDSITLSKQLQHAALQDAFLIGKGLAAVAARYAFAMIDFMWDYVAFDDPTKLAFAWIGARACFPAGTQVAVRLADDGRYETKSIETLAEGDVILTRDQADVANAVRRGQVTRVFSRKSDHLRCLTIECRGDQVVIRTTDDHPFWLVHKGWTRAADLRVGDQLAGLDATAYGCVLASTRESFQNGVDVYNLEVASAHTYFVGNGLAPANWAAWVHNLCLFESIQDQFGRIGKVLALVNPVDLFTGSGASRAARDLVKVVGQTLDDAGHLIAKRLGGSGSDLANIVAQNRSINRGAYRVFEGRIASYIEDNVVEALIEVIPRYADNVTERPSWIEYVIEFADGTVWRQLFPN